MNELERRFHAAMVAAVEASRREAGYNPTYFARMLAGYGGVGAARRILADPEMKSGFTTLYLADRLDLTVEAHVIKPEFAPLFTEEEIERAKAVLKEHHYDVGEDLEAAAD
jgi:hypothetical protein